MNVIIFSHCPPAVNLRGLRPRWKTVVWIALAVSPAILILAAGVAMHFRVLGRHLAPLAAPLFLLLAMGVAAAWRRGMAGRILAAGFFALWLASGLSLRFAARHGKDDYRGAAAVAKAALAQGEIVW